MAHLRDILQFFDPEVNGFLSFCWIHVQVFKIMQIHVCFLVDYHTLDVTTCSDQYMKKILTL